MYEWKWSKGEPYYKSARAIQNVENDKEICEKAINENAIKQSLDGFINVEIDDYFNSTYSRNDDIGNKREELDNKISDRELLFQRGTNPFLQNTNYVNDVINRDNYLKPKNTTTDKIIIDT